MLERAFTLAGVLHAALPAAAQQLAASDHLGPPTSTTSAGSSSSSNSKKRGTSPYLEAELHRYLYSFARESRFRPSFGRFKFRYEELIQAGGKGKQRAAERGGRQYDSLLAYDPDEDDEDDMREEQDEDQEDEEEDEWTLSGAQAKADESGLPSEYSKNRKGKPCGHVFKKGESVYRCKECSLDESCVLCARCFKNSSHEGHEVAFSMHTGAGGSGCCDCGDPEAFKREVDCCYHHPNMPYPSTSTSASASQAAEEPIPPASEELQRLIRSRIREAVDFLLNTLSQFPRDTTAPTDPRVIRATRPLYRLPYEEFDKPGSFPGPWSVILWNDEKHDYEQVIDQLVSATKCTRTQALASAVRIDGYGLEVVATGSDPTKLWKVAHVIGRIGLGITVCATRDAAVLEAAGHIMDWLLDMSRTRLGGDETLLGRMVAEALLEKDALAKLLILEDKLWKRARAAFRLVLMALLVVGQDVKLELGRQYASVYPQLVSTYLLTDREPESSVSYFSVQLFSAPSIATDLVANKNFLPTVLQLLYSFFTQQHSDPITGEKGIQYPPSSIHPAVDPESSSFKHKRYLSVFQELDHLLSHPGVGAQIVSAVAKEGDETLDMLLRFLNLFAGMNPQTRASAVHVEYETDSWLTAFNLTIQLAKMARSFGSAFHPSLPISSGPLSASYTVGAPEFLAATSAILASIWKTVSQQTTEVRPIEFAGAEWDVIKYEVWKEPMSFHHPTHILYAEAMKNLEAWDDAAIQKATHGQAQNYAEWIAGLNNSAFQRIVDEVLRVFALLAHIRAGLWVRNGFGIRAQCLHYREYNLRENTFDQDVFFLQTACVTMDPSLLLVSLVDRFELRPALVQGLSMGPYSDIQPAQTVLEELLYLLIIVFSEPTDIEAHSGEQQVRRELVHALLLAPLNYTDVMKHVTDRVNEDPAFDRVLREVADFRPPDLNAAGSDVGALYSLKKECYAEVDPYYYRYTRNQREEALKILKAHFDNNGVFVPRKLQGKGCFATSRFTEILASKIFIWTIQQSLIFAIPTLDTFENTDMAIADAVVDLALRLLMMALVEQPVAFSSLAVAPSRVRNADEHSVGLVADLKAMRAYSAAKEHHEKVDYIIGEIFKLQPEAAGPTAAMPEFRSKNQQEADKPAGEDAAAALAEQKKAAAKARQAAIMQQFSAQQQAFLDANMSDEDDEDDDDLDGDDDLGLINRNHGKQASDSPMREDGAQKVPDSSAISVQPEQEARQNKRKRKTASMGSCIVCQEELTSQNPWGSLALIQTSSLIRLTPPGEAFLEEIYETPTDLDKDAEHLRPFGLAGIETSEKEGKGGVSHGFPRRSRKGLFASACGHMMHVSCFDTYCSSIQQRHSSQFTRNHPENPDRKEFICPLCKSLGNILLPVSDEDYEDEPLASPATGISDDWLVEAGQTLSMASAYEMQLAYHLLSRDSTGSLRPWKVSDTLPTHNASFGFASLSQSERKMLERLISVVSPLDTESRMLDDSVEGRAISSLPHDLVAYTISCIEIALRGKPTGTLGARSVPDATAKLLRSLLSGLERLVVLNTGTPRGPELARLALLLLIFNEQQGVHVPHWLNRDSFTLLVEAAAVAPADFYQFAALTFYSHLLRLSHKLLATDSSKQPPSFSEKQSLTADQLALADYVFTIQEERWARSGVEVTPAMRLSARAASERAYAHALLFLRRAAILHGVIFPTSTGAAAAPTSGQEGSELTRLLQALRIPHPRELAGRRHGKAAQKSTGLSSMLEKWDASWLASTAANSEQPTFDTPEIVLEHPVIYELLGLPKHIDMLVESSVTRKCRRCRSVPSHPAICLLCGELVCQQSHCCMDQDLGEEPLHGECNMHMWECGTSTGIYLLIKKNAIIYLYADKGAFQAAPYLDSHGEPDLGFRRHRPLYLNRARYDEIRKLWLNHSVATYVARRLDMGSDSGGWNTL